MMVAVPDDDHTVVMRVPVIAMHAAVSNHDSFSTCNRRRRNGDGDKCGNDISKLLHSVSSSVERGLNVTRDATFPRNLEKLEENSERPFRLRCAREFEGARIASSHSMMA
jgi:hypothetical protein